MLSPTGSAISGDRFSSGTDEDVTLDGGDEPGEVAVVDDRPELLLGFKHAGGGLALARVAVCQGFALRWV